jgi:hypothetical protein
MFSKELLARCLTAARNRATVSTPKSTISWATQRYASTSAMSIGNKAILDHTFLQYTRNVYIEQSFFIMHFDLFVSKIYSFQSICS